MMNTKVLLTVLLTLTFGAVGTLMGQVDNTNQNSESAIPTIGNYPEPTENLFNAYPNPNSSDLLSIELEHAYIGVMKVQVYDVYGRLYYSKTVDKFDNVLDFSIDASGWTPGMYIIALISSEVCGSQRVLKE